jgi:hypothetical protein
LVTVPHEPDERWDCRSCGSAWPCGEAREALLDEYKDRPGHLGIFMCRMLEDATPVLGATHPDVMFQRFIAWTRCPPLDVALPSPDAGVPRA